MSGDRTPWYDSVRIYRQPKLMDWDSVFAKVCDDLRLRMASKPLQGAADFSSPPPLTAAPSFFAHEGER
jgi:hypothetical protein